MCTRHAVRLLAIGVVLLPSGSAAADARPPLSMAKARVAIYRFIQDDLNRADAGVATVGRCARLAPWKVRCSVSIGYTNGSSCLVQIAASNRRRLHGHHETRFSHRILSCRPPPESDPLDGARPASTGRPRAGTSVRPAPARSNPDELDHAERLASG